jgi:polar amino acid transport system substrate-binding protein
MKRVLFLFLCLLSFLANGEVKLVVLEYPPYVTLNSKNEVDGLAVKIVEQIFAQLGKPITISVLPWGRAIIQVRSGKADGIFTAFKTSEREQFVRYIDGVLFEQNIVAIRSNESTMTWHEAIFEKSRLCLVNNVSYGRYIDEMVEKKRFKIVIRVKLPEQCLQLLRYKRVDFWISNEAGARYISATNQLKGQLIFEQPPIESIPSYIAFSKRGSVTLEEIAQFDEALEKMKNSGEYRNIINQYFSDISSGLQKPSSDKTH